MNQPVASGAAISPALLWSPKIGYAQHLHIFTHEPGLDEQTKKAILGETAQRLWFQGRRGS